MMLHTEFLYICTYCLEAASSIIVAQVLLCSAVIFCLDQVNEFNLHKGTELSVWLLVHSGLNLSSFLYEQLKEESVIGSGFITNREF